MDPLLTGEKTFCQEGAPAHTRDQTFPPKQGQIPAGLMGVLPLAGEPPCSLAKNWVLGL